MLLPTRDYRESLLTKSMNLLTFELDLGDTSLAMHPGLQVAIGACVVAITIATVLAVLALRRVLQRLEHVLTTVEREVSPTAAETQGLLSEARGLTREARDELARVGAVVDRTRDAMDKVGRTMATVASFTRAGQLIGLASSLRTGVDVFIRRLRRP